MFPIDNKHFESPSVVEVGSQTLLCYDLVPEEKMTYSLHTPIPSCAREVRK